MRLFGFCSGGSIAIVRTETPALFLTYNRRVAPGPMYQTELMEAARVAVPVTEFGKTLSPDMGRAINGAIQAAFGQ